MDAAGMRQCLINAGMPGMSENDCLLAYFQVICSFRASVHARVALVGVREEKAGNSESIALWGWLRDMSFSLITVIVYADNATRNAAEEALKQSFAADPATHFV